MEPQRESNYKTSSDLSVPELAISVGERNEQEYSLPGRMRVCFISSADEMQRLGKG
jgi:hypothetical protein